MLSTMRMSKMPYKMAKMEKTPKQLMGFIIPIAVMLLLAATITSANATADLRVFVTGGTGNLVHELDLKATEGANGQIIPVSGFTIEPGSVVQMHQNGILQVFTSTNEPERIDAVKVTTPAGQIVELIQIGTGWSLQGLANGVYLLDVIVNIPDGSKGAYETVLVVLAPNEPSKNTAQVIKQVVKVDTKIVFEPTKNKPDIRRICFLDPADTRCPKPDPKTGECPPGWGMNDDDQCVPHGKCPPGHSRLDEDETSRCYPDKDTKRCPNGGIVHKFQECPDEPLPICDIDMSVTPCIDEEGFIDCEPGFRDYGSGCEPIRETGPSPGCECPVGMDCTDVVCPDPLPLPEPEPEATDEDDEDEPEAEEEEAEEENDGPIEEEDEQDNEDADESTDTGSEEEEVPSLG
jgi:hypothetical protein